ncbi:MAG: AraC family transcriptional regulator [bacterium]|nr:AraC family transcriptional regulator [bacterium]
MMNAVEKLERVLPAILFLEDLYDPVTDTVFFIKDWFGRYVIVNQTLVARCGRNEKSEIIGHTACELFSDPLGQRYLEQDRKVIDEEKQIIDRLELHPAVNQREQWCLTNKVPIRTEGGEVVGLVGFSRDLMGPGVGEDWIRPELAAVVSYIQVNYASELRVERLAEQAGMSPYQLSQRIRTIFGITPAQLIAKTRIDAASSMLRTTDSAIAEIAQSVGYCDQSAFSRHFKVAVGLTPSQYRKLHN